jgi:surfeit locus 1 family protein
VLVQRGWLPRDATERTRIAPVPTVEGRDVTVIGRLAPPPSRIYDFDGAPTGAIRQNVDVGEFATETGLAIRPVSILQTEVPATDPPDNLQRDWPAFQADLHKHYGYAFQWFALSALTAFLYVWFQLIRPRRSARAP